MNYNLILYGKNEFYNNISNKQYNILIILDDNKEKFMNDIITQKVNDNNIIYVGIDFEFNKISRTDRDVSLMQINIEDNTNIGHIFVLDPRRLKNKNVLINLLTSDKTIKVLHGSESLDIPYLFNKFYFNLYFHV
jgi:ribonuclease D